MSGLHVSLTPSNSVFLIPNRIKNLDMLFKMEVLIKVILILDSTKISTLFHKKIDLYQVFKF
jgi:hypothetical protein